MAVGDEYLASVRHSVRLSSTVHDVELTDLINAARADLVLGGVLEEKANDERCLPIRKHRGAREKRYSFGYAVFLILALMK